MATRYSIYEAKARLSELLRLVKGGAEVTVTERGEPVAKVIPFPRETTLENRFRGFVGLGLITPRPQKAFHARGRRVKDGLKRFLDERE